ncbi:helicase C-terminal domain-containing protein, partial [Gemmatimonadota bacterium]
SPQAAEFIRAEISRAGGKEVSFLVAVGEGRVLEAPRAVSRGNRSAVLVAAKGAPIGSVVLHNHPSGNLEPSEADLAVAAELYQRGLGTAIVDNMVSGLYVVVEPPPPRTVEPLDLDELEAMLGPGGNLARSLPAFEDRPGQRAMARLVAERYNSGGVALVEAGTGTGKSMAYLLPAALWALRNEERTVVSTNTINLQEQLTGKDLPLLRDVLGENLRWALVKGRGNYISIRRAHLAALSAPSLFEEDRAGEIQSLLDWIDTTVDGSLSDLSSPPSEEVWEEVRSEPDICLRARCPHFQACFFQRARRDAASAQILVVNHHLLFTDLSVRRATDNFTQAAVLPPYRHLILDEAHHVEEAATSHLGVGVTRRGLFRLLARLERRGRGVLADVMSHLEGNPALGSAPELLDRIRDRVRPALEEARSRVEPLLSLLEEAFAGEGDTFRIGGQGGPEPLGNVAVREGLDSLLLALRKLAREVGELRARIEGDEGWTETLEGRLLDLRSVQNRLLSTESGIRRVLDPGDEASGLVRWLELRKARQGRGRNLTLAAAPIEVGPILREDLFLRQDGTILTSATLTTRAGFEYLRSRLGLDDPGLLEEEGLSVEEEVVASPFDFAIQSLLAIPTDLSGPSEGGGRFSEETAQVVRDLASITGGGLFVLFTSHRSLREVAGLLEAQAAGLPGPIFVQGDAPRAKLLHRFVEAGHGILLGTASFWEGVDVPGDPLRGLVLQKLPFQVPTEPITAARMESIVAQGGDPFWRFTLPHAALRLKQGFGRLIRTQEDRGAVLILDDRILSRRYGSYLRQSLPPAPLAKGLWPDLLRVLEEFYGEV